MDENIDSSSALIDLQGAVSMASFDDSIGSSEVFISDGSFPPPPPGLLATGSSNSSFMSTLTSASRNEPSSPFPQHHDPFSLTKRFSAVGLKEQDPMWDSTARKTPEPVASCRPRPKRDLHFIEDLITLTGGHWPSFTHSERVTRTFSNDWRRS